MNISRVLTGATMLGAITSVALAPAAFAANVQPTIQLSGGDAKQATVGGVVGVSGQCSDKAATVQSPVLELDKLTHSGDDVSAAGRVKASTKPGSYQVVLVCGEKKVTADFMVQADKVVATTSTPGSSAAPITESPSVVPSTRGPRTTATPDGTPKGAPQTGGGGTADDGGNIGLLALGGAVIVGGAGVGVWAVRRRSSQS